MLDGHTCDILSGEDFLDMTTAFESYRDAFAITESDDDAAEVNGIVCFNIAKSHLSQGIDALALRPRSGSGSVSERSPGKLSFYAHPSLILDVLIVSRAIGRKLNAANEESR